jgi:NAD(P)H-dependent FMN reductase
MAEAAVRGAVGDPDVSVSLLTAPNTRVRDVLDADGYIFATPENLAAMAGVMKAFFDRTYYPVLDHVNGRPYASMICAGSDGENAARQIARIATGWRLRAIAPPLIACTRAQTPEAILAPKVISMADRHRCAELGTLMTAGLAAGVF